MASKPRVAVVAGALSAVGLASARMLATSGHHVITVDSAPSADFRVDVSDPRAVNRAAGNIGPVDVLINSTATIGPSSPLWEIRDDAWAHTLAVNVTGTFNLCRAFVPAMIDRGWGRIVNFGSVAGKEGNAQMSAYSASKAAVIAMTKSLGKELASTGVLANVIVQGTIDSPLLAGTRPDIADRLKSLTPMKRSGQPEEVAELVAWLTSDKCSYSTGAVYDISGGRATY